MIILKILLTTFLCSVIFIGSVTLYEIVIPMYIIAKDARKIGAKTFIENRYMILKREDTEVRVPMNYDGSIIFGNGTRVRNRYQEAKLLLTSKQNLSEETK